ncbi:MAG: hypothetical protein M3373_14390 [Gemmatimonadota bacterium]|nr:hypothetical protein [Gemmatimonadota bacterium]
MSGREVAQSIKMIRPGIRVLFMSGYAREELSALSDLCPRRDLIEKPFSVEDSCAELPRRSRLPPRQRRALAR